MERLSTLLPVGRGDPAIHHGARRRSCRYRLEADVVFLDPTGVRGVAINASAGGLRVAVNQPVPVGELCVLQVRFTRRQRVVEHARVVWARELPDGWVLGLEFVNAN